MRASLAYRDSSFSSAYEQSAALSSPRDSIPHRPSLSLSAKSLLDNNWQLHGKLALEMMMQMAIEKKTQAEEWGSPHVEIIKTKWAPAIKQQWVVIATKVEPHVKSLSEKTIEKYETSKVAVTPLIKVEELMNP